MAAKTSLKKWIYVFPVSDRQASIGHCPGGGGGGGGGGGLGGGGGGGRILEPAVGDDENAGKPSSWHNLLQFFWLKSKVCGKARHL